MWICYCLQFYSSDKLISTFWFVDDDSSTVKFPSSSVWFVWVAKMKTFITINRF